MRRYSIILLACCLAFAACTSEPKSKIPSSVQESLALLPAETNLLFYCNFNKITASPLASQFIDNLDPEKFGMKLHDRDFEEFMQATGLDLRKDLYDILVGSILQYGERKEQAFAIVHGNFEEDRLIQYLESKLKKARKAVAWEMEEYNGYRLYSHRENDSRISACFADENTLYIGPDSWVKEVLAGQLTSRLPEQKDFFARLKKDVNYGDQFWVAMDSKFLAEPYNTVASGLRRRVPALETVRAAVFSAEADKELGFSGKLLCDSPESSEVMVDLMRGALAAAKLSVSHDRSTVDELNKIKIYQKGNAAVLQGVITDSFIQTLRKHSLQQFDRL